MGGHWGTAGALAAKPATSRIPVVSLRPAILSVSVS